ncbi:MAG TPA: hypothetical protein VHW24_27250 [Bryobacteraceae bacterium]|nr:hypothetical protein [Bryobacteraceae bacterium]
MSTCQKGYRVRFTRSAGS